MNRSRRVVGNAAIRTCKKDCLLKSKYMSAPVSNTSGSPVIVEKTYGFPASTVWSALTDQKKMKQWYFDIKEFRPEVGFAFSFSGGTKEKSYTHDCVVTQVIPERKLAFSWRYRDYPGDSEVSFELFPEGQNTKVRVTHTGIGSFPGNDPNFAVESFSKGWEHIFGKSLAGFLAKVDG